jgi:rfaE bifunctional protein kinase chain/domain
MTDGPAGKTKLASGKPKADAAVIAAYIRSLAGEGARIALVSGKFNIIHPGHLRLFRFAADNADFLVVGALPDEDKTVSVPAELRIDALRSISIVSYACVIPGSVEDFIATLRPDVVVKGKEYEDRENSELEALETYGGKLLFGSGEVRFSSIQLIQEEYGQATWSSIQKPRDYPARHGFDLTDLQARLDAFSGLKVVVLGDLIVDTYITCDPLGMSEEDPTIVVTPIEQTTFVGGAGIVAAHARGLGADVRFLSVTGHDEQSKFARTALAGFDVAADLLIDPSRPTTHKQRYRARGKTLLRVNELRQHAIDAEISKKFTARALELVKTADVVLFADFNYGCLPQHVVDAVTAEARKRKAWIGADSQASSQMSDISRFKGMDLITPTEKEARLALGNFEDGLSVLAEELQAKAKCTNTVITLGAEGLLTYGVGNAGYMIDRLPALNRLPKDVAGAGDSLFATTSLALRAGADIWSAVYLGAVAAACQVSRVGNIPLKRQELADELRRTGQ